MQRFCRLCGVIAIALCTTAVVNSPPPVAPPIPSFLVAPEGYSAYAGQGACDPVEKPGVQDFRDLVLATYPTTDTYGIVRACDIGAQSEHKEGRAWDWKVDFATQGHIAARLLHWLMATRDGQPHALLRRLGIMYVIWNRRIFKAYQPNLGWQAYTGQDPHTNHVHFSFGRAGAWRETTWWTAVAPPHPL